MKKIILILLIGSFLVCSSGLTNEIYAQTNVSGLDFTEAAKSSTPTVVHVISTCEEHNKQGSNNVIYDLLFGREYNTKTSISFGSGVIISHYGYIVTNHHVIDDATKIQVVLHDKRMFDAVLIGKDPNTDLALLKIEGDNLPFMKLGDSDKLVVGQWVLAVGHPFNLTSTVTAGIVSAKSRDISILAEHKYATESFIQTDAAVNKGNSGGALVNLKGELVGINSAILSPSGAYAGYSFAIPVNLVRKIVSDFILFGEVQKAVIGVSIEEVTSAVATSLGLNKIEGVLVATIDNSGAASKAGVLIGDIILSVNGVKVNKTAELTEQMGKYRPGECIKLTIKRNNVSKTFKIVLRNIRGTTETINSREAGSEMEVNGFLNLMKQ